MNLALTELSKSSSTPFPPFFSSMSGPIAIIGDFNLTLIMERRNSNFNHSEASLFNDCINTLCLIELPLLDRRFTWSNQHSSHILVRLDRAFINSAWSFALPDSTLSSDTRSLSDHVPIRLEASSKAPRSSLFRLDNSWLANARFSEIVSSNWLSVHDGHGGKSALSCLCLRLKRIRSAARLWAKSHRPPSVLSLLIAEPSSTYSIVLINSVPYRHLNFAFVPLPKARSAFMLLPMLPIGNKGQKSGTAPSVMKTPASFTSAPPSVFKKTKSTPSLPMMAWP